MKKKAVLKDFAIFTGNISFGVSFKKRLQHRCFPVNIAKFLGTPFLQNISGRLLLFLIKTSAMLQSRRVKVIK